MGGQETIAILGISEYYYDSAAALVTDREIVDLIEGEKDLACFRGGWNSARVRSAAARSLGKRDAATCSR